VNIVETKSFSLATIAEGNPNSGKVALILPGRLDTKDYSCFTSHLQYLASKGFYALAFDPPGTWDSPGGVELFTTTNYIQSVNELIECLGNKSTLLLGHSRGGAVATLAGTTNPHVKALVLINPSLGAPTPPEPGTANSGLYTSYRDLPPGTRETSEQKKFEVPLAYFEDGAKYDDAQTLKSCAKPKLVLHSKSDEYTTDEEVKQVFESIPEPKVLYELEGNHDYRYYPEVVIEVNQQIGLFLEKYPVKQN
jgi:pimeloyl-ACP methyl ester carboxylesterase